MDIILLNKNYLLLKLCYYYPKKVLIKNKCWRVFYLRKKLYIYKLILIKNQKTKKIYTIKLLTMDDQDYFDPEQTILKKYKVIEMIG